MTERLENGSVKLSNGTIIDADSARELYDFMKRENLIEDISNYVEEDDEELESVNVEKIDEELMDIIIKDYEKYMDNDDTRYYALRNAITQNKSQLIDQQELGEAVKENDDR